jgi:hypothetical protein
MASIKSTFANAKQIYDRYARFISAISFIVGFTLDFLTTRRIDVMWDNYKLLGYVFLAGTCIILFHFIESKRIRNRFFVKYENLIRMGIEFFLGGLFSSHVIFYFKSSAGVKSFLFIAVLFVLLIINQFFKKQVYRLYLQFSMYFLAAFSFFVFFIPVFTKEMNATSFLFGSTVSLGVTITIIAVVCLATSNISRKPFMKLSGLILVLYFAMTLFYFMNWIPPVPMALKHIGIYHHVNKTDYFYNLTYEKPPLTKFWETSSTVYHYVPGDTVFCFASVFAPTAMKKTIYHRWKYYNKQTGAWEVRDRLSYDLLGGRDGGFRGFSSKTFVAEGEWRIEVVTEDDLLLGSVDFELNVVNPQYERKLVSIKR